MLNIPRGALQLLFHPQISVLKKAFMFSFTKESSQKGGEAKPKTLPRCVSFLISYTRAVALCFKASSAAEDKSH